MTHLRDIPNKIRRRVSRIRRCIAHRRADESGLTTLEWLLIVAAVAGLAALAVVLVQNVVDDTSEQISGSSARVTAARLAADQIVQDADRGAVDQPAGAKKYGQWKNYYTQKCNRLEITYGDAGIISTPNFAFGTKTGGTADLLTADRRERKPRIQAPPFTDNNDADDYRCHRQQREGRTTTS